MKYERAKNQEHSLRESLDGGLASWQSGDMGKSPGAKKGIRLNCTAGKNGRGNMKRMTHRPRLNTRYRNKSDGGVKRGFSRRRGNGNEHKPPGGT